VNPLYTAEALATGDGRNGRTRSASGRIDFKLDAPAELGGSGVGTNPEELFAAGYAACFHSALQLVARQAKADTTDSAVGAQVSLVRQDGGGFGLAVVLEASLPNVPGEQAQALLEQAHQVCPYSTATRGNINVELRLAED
jgi:lipoyl-dependent peroxiredoxin